MPVIKMSSASIQNTASLVRVAELPPRGRISFEHVFTKHMLDQARAALAVPVIGKVWIMGEIAPEGKENWSLNAVVGATVTQNCVISLKPVTTRIDVPVHRLFVVDWEEPESDTVVEMAIDVDTEPLGETIDFERIALETIALAIPTYPRAEGAALKTSAFAGPGVTPLSDADVKPFASLAVLKDKLAE